MKRLPAADRKAQTIAVMNAMAAAARDQSDFTAAKVAAASGISSTMLYRVAGGEFRATRSTQSGTQSGDLYTSELRRAYREARVEVDRLREIAKIHATCVTHDELRAVVEHNERLEEDNRSLRAQYDLLQRRAGIGAPLPPLRSVGPD